MKTTIIALSVTFLISSCKDKIVCEQINSAQIRPVVIKNLSFVFNRCRVACFNLNTWNTYKSLNACQQFKDDPNTPEIEHAEEYEDYDVSFCDNLLGFDAAEAAKNIRPKIKELAAIKKDNCKI